ncbi:hypothetical protein [Aeoliella sp.]|uniref:hypothetical protein n=1 Tax=Aeoliella sp. TaxID=2795800 RepID=UPI003CCBC904
MTTYNHPSELTTEEVVPYFLRFARELLSQPVSSRKVVEEFVQFYRSCRVVGAPIEDGYDADTFCIEWCRVDLKEQQISIRRTVHAVDALPEYSEFDDDAFEMVITLSFGPTDDEASCALEVSTIEELDSELETLLKNSLIAKLLEETPADTSAFVGGAG